MKQVYMCFSTDIIHSGHLAIIKKAAQLGAVTAGALCDTCVAMYERYPLIPQSERIAVLQNIKGITNVVVQNDIYYDEILRELRPDYVVHGDNWRSGYQKPVRERVIEVLREWGGELIEFPCTLSDELATLSRNFSDRPGLPEARRQRLRRQLHEGAFVRVLEAHDGLSALLVENTLVQTDNGGRMFDGIWISSLCDSTVKGKPDIELVDLTSRLQKADEIMDVTTKPIIFDADTGGLPEHFAYNIKTMERFGLSAVIIEDKKGLKRNSLLGNDVAQTQDEISDFCDKIRVGKRSVQSTDFMIIARIESLVLDRPLSEALERAFAYVEAGADGIMIHSRAKEPLEVFEFCKEFRKREREVPIVVVPTTYHAVTEEALREAGVNMVIYANHLLRAAFPAMQAAARLILESGRSLEADSLCMPVKEILSLIPFRD